MDKENPLFKRRLVQTMKSCIEPPDIKTTEKFHPRVIYNGVAMPLSRAVWIYYRGEIPKGLVVKHSCDNRRCINIAHLSIGTQSENLKEAVERGRIPVGGRHYLARKVVNRLTGQVFGSIKEAGESIGMKKTTLAAQLNGENSNRTNFQYYDYKQHPRRK